MEPQQSSPSRSYSRDRTRPTGASEQSPTERASSLRLAMRPQCQRHCGRPTETICVPDPSAVGAPSGLHTTPKDARPSGRRSGSDGCVGLGSSGRGHGERRWAHSVWRAATYLDEWKSCSAKKLPADRANSQAPAAVRTLHLHAGGGTEPACMSAAPVFWARVSLERLPKAVNTGRR